MFNLWSAMENFADFAEFRGGVKMKETIVV